MIRADDWTRLLLFFINIFLFRNVLYEKQLKVFGPTGKCRPISSLSTPTFSFSLSLFFVCDFSSRRTFPFMTLNPHTSCQRLQGVCRNQRRFISCCVVESVAEVAPDFDSIGHDCQRMTLGYLFHSHPRCLSCMSLSELETSKNYKTCCLRIKPSRHDFDD